MTRMTREFSLVLLGAGMLTAAYMLWPEQDQEAKANEQAQQRVAGTSGRMHGFIWIHSSGLGTSTSRAGAYTNSAGVSRGGFGGASPRFARRGSTTRPSRRSMPCSEAAVRHT